jgi:hypothetical protein
MGVNDYSGVNRVYTKDRFVYEVYVNGKLIGVQLTNDDADEVFNGEMKKMNAKSVDFINELKSLIDSYRVDIVFENDSIVFKFNDDVTVPFIVDGNSINVNVL